MRSLGTYLFVSDIDDALAFYGRLGLETEKVSDMFGRATVNGSVALELGTAALTSSYDENYINPPTVSKGTINFELDSRAQVDEMFEQLVAAGYTGHLAPIDALWQARFAIVLDPDGNQVGLHSPRDLEADRNREQS